MVCPFVWNQIAQQLAMTQPQLLSVKTTSPALWFSVGKTQILRLERWHFLPRPAWNCNPELLTDPETACSETHLSVTPVRGVGYCSLITWTKSAKYWISGNPCISYQDVDDTQIQQVTGKLEDCSEYEGRIQKLHFVIKFMFSSTSL